MKQSRVNRLMPQAFVETGDSSGIGGLVLGFLVSMSSEK